MIKRLAVLALTVTLLVFVSVLFAQEAPDTPEPDKTPEATDDMSPRTDLTAYAWETGDLAVFIPSLSEPTLSDNEATLTATTDDGLIRYGVLDSRVTDDELYARLESALLAPDLGLTLTTYERLTLYGRLGWRVDGTNFSTGALARGRIGRLPDDRVLITIALAADEPTLARRADAAAYGVAFGAAGTPDFPTNFPPDHMGAAMLTQRIPVQGYLDETNPTQQWTYLGTAGEQVSFIAVDLARTYVFDLQLDMAIRVYNPDGTEFGYNDDQVGTDLFGAYDALLPEVTLPANGEYIVQVEWIAGAGTYTLGITGNTALTFTDDGATTINGRLTNVFTFDRYVFSARQGDSFTFTLTAESGGLDPLLEITRDNGQALAFNDDAEDTTLGTDAQIAALVIPADGVYVVEAGRFSGTGAYQLTITKNN